MKVLLVIDMLKDFIEAGGALYCGEEGKRIVPVIKKKADEYRAAGDKVIYLCDAHDQLDVEFNRFERHAVKGTEGGEIVDELKPEPSDIVIEKTTLSSFYKTDLEKILEELAPSIVEVSGACTSICVMDAVADLKARGYNIVVHRDAVADFDREAAAFALKRMANVYGARVEQ